LIAVKWLKGFMNPIAGTKIAISAMMIISAKRTNKTAERGTKTLFNLQYQIH